MNFNFEVITRIYKHWRCPADQPTQCIIVYDFITSQETRTETYI